MDLLAKCFGHELPTIPVVFRHTIFNREDRIFLHQILIILHHLLGGFGGFVRLAEDIPPILKELTRSRVKRKKYVLAGLIIGFCNGIENNFNRFFV